MNVLEFERLLEQLLAIAVAAIIPGRNVRVMFVIALGFAIRSLILLAKMAAARFVAFQRIHTHQLSQFEKIGDTSGLFEALIKIRAAARHSYVLPVLLAQ